MTQKEQFEKLIAEFIEAASILMPGVTTSIALQNIDPKDLVEIADDCKPSYSADSATGSVTYKLGTFKWLDSGMNHALHLHSRKIVPTPINQ